jgi:hypothetical protein
LRRPSRTPIRRSRKDAGKKIAATLGIHSFEYDVKAFSIPRNERKHALTLIIASEKGI